MSCEDEGLFAAIVAGDTRGFDIEFLDAAGAPINIGGWHILVTFKADILSADDAVGDGYEDITIPSNVESAAGIAHGAINSVVSSLVPGTYYARIRLTNATPQQFTLTEANQTIEVVP